jgi:SPX domain protein involved in polyphosphate accumulation
MAQKTLPFRHEQKYYISQGEHLLLSRRLSLTMDRDRYANQDGEYFIRSLYFDDLYDSAMQQKLDGIEERKKYRLRIYGLSDKIIKLECKEKRGAYIRKRSLGISRKACDALIDGDAGPLLEYGSPLGNEVYLLTQTKGLRPAVVVDYMREAYVAPFEDVRITFDKDLRSGMFFRGSLFDKDLPTVPVLSDYDMILEVKFNDHLADYYRSLLSVKSAQRSAVSKYCICRRFD